MSSRYQTSPDGTLMRLIKSLLTASAICVLTTNSAQAEWEGWLLPNDFIRADTFEKAVAIAKDKDKALIVYYTRTSCPPCSLLQSRLRQEEVAALFRDKYVFTAVWGSAMGMNERESYRRRFDVQGAPTWIAFDKDGKYLCTSPGGFFSFDEARAIHEGIQARLSTPVFPHSSTRCTSRPS